MFWTRTRPHPGGADDPALCGRIIRTGRLCANTATMHHVAADARSRTGYIDYSTCPKHTPDVLAWVLDSHHIGAVCLHKTKTWQLSTGASEGFCYHPEEETALHEELSRTLQLSS